MQTIEQLIADHADATDAEIAALYNAHGAD
jgi:hypothetical protein